MLWRIISFLIIRQQVYILCLGIESRRISLIQVVRYIDDHEQRRDAVVFKDTCTNYMVYNYAVSLEVHTNIYIVYVCVPLFLYNVVSFTYFAVVVFKMNMWHDENWWLMDQSRFHSVYENGSIMCDMSVSYIYMYIYKCTITRGIPRLASSRWIQARQRK